MKLHIHGIGYIGMGLSEPKGDTTSRLEKIPIENYTKPGFRRRFGRLSKLLFVASGLAMEDAKVIDPASLSIVTATALGEAEVSIKLLTQIHASGGKTLSPGLVPNSVHSAPAGYLSIGHKNHKPSLTVSQGWLSAEAAVGLAQDMAGSGIEEKFLIVAGDEADPDWATSLAKAGAHHFAEAVEKEAFHEGAVALVVGIEPEGNKLGTIGATVARCTKDPLDIRNLLKANRMYPSGDAEVRIRLGTAHPEWRQTVAIALDRPLEAIQIDGVGVGTSMAGGFATLVDRMENSPCEELLVLGSELDDVSVLHWTKAPSWTKAQS